MDAAVLKSPERTQEEINRKGQQAQSDPEMKVEDVTEKQSTVDKGKRLASKEHNKKYEKFVTLIMSSAEFPISHAMELVPASKRYALEKKWADVDKMVIDAYETRTRVVQDVLQVIR